MKKIRGIAFLTVNDLIDNFKVMNNNQKENFEEGEFPFGDDKPESLLIHYCSNYGYKIIGLNFAVSFDTYKETLEFLCNELKLNYP